MRLGFCGPLVCNRMLLWGLFGTLLIGLSIVVIFHYAAYCEANIFTRGPVRWVSWYVGSRSFPSC